MNDLPHPEFLVFKKRLFSQDAPNLNNEDDEMPRALTIVRYNQDKPRYLLIKEVSIITGKAASTVRDVLKRLNIIALKEKRQSVLQSLRRVSGSNFVSPTAPCVALLRVLDFARVLEYFEMESSLVEEIRSLNRSNPEPLNLNWSRSDPPPLSTPPPPPPYMAPHAIALHEDILQFEFPNTLPTLTLTPEQAKEKYSLPSEMMDARLNMRIREFTTWSSTPINLSRSQAYSQSVQSSTLEGNIACIRAYWGYILLHHHIPLNGIDLELYQDPGIFIRFLSYIRARGVQTTHVLKHISLARKMLDFLQSGSPEDSPIRAHTVKMDAWLNVLGRQLTAIAPVQGLATLPIHSNVQAWGMYKINVALEAIESDMLTYGHLTHTTAIDVQRAIVISLVCGLYWPPLRLSWIKSLSHPRYHQCFDPNCLEGQSCLGNHIKVEHVPGVASESSRWHFGYNDKVCLRLNIIHNKNDRRSSRSNYQIGFNLPDCHVTKLFFAHIKEGHRLITLSQPDPIVRLFVSEEGNGFSDATFQHFWVKVMNDSSLFDVSYFAPSKGRTIFFTEWSTTHGVNDSDDLEAIASIMGNSSKTLINHYAPLRKRRLTQRMVNERASLACDQFRSAMLRSQTPAHQSESGPSHGGAQASGIDPNDDPSSSELEESDQA